MSLKHYTILLLVYAQASDGCYCILLYFVRVSCRDSNVFEIKAQDVDPLP